MEESSENINSFKIFVKTTLVTPTSEHPRDYAFIHENTLSRTAEHTPQFDFYLPIFLTRTSQIEEFVQVDRDPTIYKIERQEINPWYLEYSFFDTITRNKINKGADISGSTLFDYIRTLRPEISTFTNSQVRTWFDSIGKSELPWNGVTIDDLDKFIPNNDSVVSKAFAQSIDVNN